MGDVTGSHTCADHKLMSRAARQLMRLHVPRQTTKTDQEVPLVFRETCLHSGYRIPGKSWSYYLASFCQVHNESGNVWTHFLAVFIFLYKLHELCVTVDVNNEPLSWPILGFTINIIIYASLSTFAHLFQSVSPLVHYTCFQIDYIGIGLNSFGTGLLLYYMTGSEAYYAVIGPELFMYVNTVMAIAVCMTCSISKLHYTRPYPPQRKILQFASVGSHVIFNTIPLICYCKQCLLDDPQCTAYDAWTQVHAFLWFFSSLFFFASHLPEKLAPGRFDIVGHGHQIFHVLMIVTSLVQLHAGMTQVHRRPPHLVNMSKPDAHLIFGSIISVISVCTLFIVLTHAHRKSKIAKDEKLQMMQESKAD